MLKREMVMSIPQFNAYGRGEKTIKDIKLENGMESIAGYILNNKRLTRIATFIIAGINLAAPVFADSIDACTKINQAGNMFFGIVQTIGYWLCLIGCIIELLKAVMNGCNKDVGRIMLKYLMIFASVYFMPWAFDLIRDIFK